MQKLGLNEIRERFLKFFESKDHLRLLSFPLVPRNDDSLLLINSGMAPLKPYFTGKEEPPRRRVTTCQKCIRTPDIENVGKTARHGTFFEMLGNFSFGDYFKKEAISWAWEFVTKDLEIPLDKLWVSIYQEDDEAFEIWNKIIGLPPERIVRLGKKDNFWEIGQGPCGPCSEIYFDRGQDKSCGDSNCSVGCDCDRYVEFWNLVFTQFNRDEAGNYTNLANPNIDTGMGLERLAVIMQGVNNLFEVDTIRSIIDYICNIAKVSYGQLEKSDVSIRIITDHIRSTTMLVSDGVIPSNEGRGYVLRRLLRRAARHGKLLGIENQFLYNVADVVINASKQAYPELDEKRQYIKKVIKIEEERFQATLDQGLGILNEFIKETKANNEKIISGSMVFKLHDTFGFPLDLTKEIAVENGLTVDENEFKKQMNNQKHKARQAIKGKVDSSWADDIYSKLDKGNITKFIGYDTFESESNILYLIKDNSSIVNTAGDGEDIVVILDNTPFYAESGGQVGDIGYLQSQNGRVRIDDCIKNNDKYLHIGVVEDGFIETGDSIIAKINYKNRLNIARNHTATHLLQKALKNTLGQHVNQAGSLVEPDRLRFDFTHFSQVNKEEISKIEEEINDIVFQNHNVTSKEMRIEEAKKLNAMALFGEKYGDIVRVVSINDYSIELCGGTHLTSTSQIGFVKIISESSVAAGVRRIEALTGEKALAYFNEKENLLNNLAYTLKATPDESMRKAESLYQELKEAQKEIEKLKAKAINSNMDDILSKAKEIKGVKVIVNLFNDFDMDTLRNTGDMIKDKIKSGVIVIGSVQNEKVSFLVTATKDVVDRGVHSGNIVKEIASIAGGGGGGRPDMAQAGGKDVSKAKQALEHSLKVIEAQIR